MKKCKIYGKKKLFALAAAFILISATGCGENTESVMESQDNAYVIEHDSMNSYLPQELPYNMDYNGNTIVFDSVDVYQTKSSSGHGYVLYAIATIDISTLDEDALYWFDKEGDTVLDEAFRISAYVTCEENNLDFESMERVKGVNYGDKRSYAFAITEEQKNPFVNSSVTVSIDLRQDETYAYINDEGDESELNKTNHYQYSKDIESESDFESVSSMDSTMIDSINEALELLDSSERIETTN